MKQINKLNGLPKAVFFDVDGTLFDTEKMGLVCQKKAAEDYGYDFSDELMKSLIGLNYEMLEKKVYDSFSSEVPVEDIMNRKKKYMHQAFDEAIPIKKGVRELLNYLKKHHIRLAVVSANSEDSIRHYLEKAGLLDLFDLILSSDQFCQSKPDPEGYLLALEIFGLKPDEALVVEDSPIGAQAGIRANVPTILVPDLLSPTEEIKEKAAAVVEDMHALKELLEETEKNRQ